MKKKAKKINWLFESSDVPFDSLWAKYGLGIKKKIYSGKSSFQKIEVYDTLSFGKMLVLDGIFQTSEGDEFGYHEMICHLPMFYHPNPKKILIIGGGDGGVLREVLKHHIDKVWMVEIDKKVVEVSKKYLPSISKEAFNSKKAEIIIGDGLKFIKKYKNFFDVIILDLSDPGGPAQKLISSDFYKDVKKALKNKGVISIQSGMFLCQSRLVSTIFKRLKDIFSSVKAHQVVVPIYGTGTLALILASDLNLNKINMDNLKKRFNKLFLKTRYYSPEIHQASGILPKSLKDIL